MTAIPTKMTAIPAEICRSLTGCMMDSQVTVGGAHGYKILAFQAEKSAKSTRWKNLIYASGLFVNGIIFLAGMAAKMKQICLFLALCCLIFNVPAIGATEISIPSNTVLEANFVQKRHFSSLPKPIESKGHMILWEGKGLLWATTTPFPNTLLITQQGLHKLENGIKVPMVKTGGDTALFDVMASLFNRKENEPVKGFTIKNLAPREGNRRISLTPQHKQVLNFIQSITLEGNTRITHITLLRPNGDRDEIEMTDHAVIPSVSDETRKLFNE